MPKVLGVDGCPHGWCAVQLDARKLTLTPVHYDTFEAILDAHPNTVIAIDVPIGLMDGPGGRECDRAARAYLRWPRRTSVFIAARAQDPQVVRARRRLQGGVPG
ncbi:MAG: DUF429 domain-containing protein [Chloroflexi bacterium]|nr:DUF429 domain-containing protein [Chloroflexota bacterium]